MKLIRTEDAVGHVLMPRYHTDHQRGDKGRCISQGAYCYRRRHSGAVIRR